jgi:hypothetical protein
MLRTSTIFQRLATVAKKQTKNLLSGEKMFPQGFVGKNKLLFLLNNVTRFFARSKENEPS